MPTLTRFVRYFMAVAEHGSIRKAADELHIAASAVDRQILLGEHALKAPLFERLPTGLRLTAAGELLFLRAKGWSKELATLQADIGDLQGLRRGNVSLAVIDALSTGRLPRLLGAIRSEYPLLEVTLRTMDHREASKAVSSGAVDFGLLVNAPASRDLAIRGQASYPIGFAVPPGHALSGRATVRASAAAELPLVAPAEPLSLAGHLARLEARCGFVFARAAVADGIHMLKSLVRAGVGIGLVSALDVDEEVGSGELAFVPVKEAEPYPLVLTIGVHPSRQLSRAANLLMRWIEMEFFEPRVLSDAQSSLHGE